MKIAIVGPGAMGLMLAARLTQAGAEVSLLDHRPQRAQLIDQQGVFLEHPQGEDHYAIPASAQPENLAGMELAIVCTKAYHTQEVARVLRAHLDPTARALTLQNGAENVETLVEALGPERVLGGITSEGATLLGPGQVRHAGRGLTHLGPAQGPLDDFTCQVRDLFLAAGFQTEANEGVQNLIWTKLVINVGINPLTAILDVLNGRLLELPPAVALMAAAVEEAVCVGRALGCALLAPGHAGRGAAGGPAHRGQHQLHAAGRAGQAAHRGGLHQRRGGAPGRAGRPAHPHQPDPDPVGAGQGGRLSGEAVRD